MDQKNQERCSLFCSSLGIVADMNAGRTARERVRAELTREISDIARGHLAVHGAAGLSLRAIAREMGMASSAIHRYFPTKDDLLTALIIDGYTAFGEAVEHAEAACARDDHLGRWLAVCRAVRGWALDHPHEYALIYGSPVPGYAAPQDTIAPASRATAVMGALVSETHGSGALVPPSGYPAPPSEFAPDAARIRALIPGVPDEVAARAVTVWTALFGWVDFELFGQFAKVIEEREAAFEHHARCLALFLGLPRT